MSYSDPFGSGSGVQPYYHPGIAGGGGFPGSSEGPIPSGSPAPAPSAPSPTSIGLAPEQYAAILYGKPIPLWVGGRSLVGCRLIEGPFFSSVTGETTVSGIAAACVPANYANDTRRITQLRLSGKEAWNGTANSSGVTTTSTQMSGLTVGGATSGTEQRIRFMFGTNTQSPDASSIARYGGDAQAYNPLVCVVFDNIKTAPYGNVIPFFSILIEDTHFGAPDEGITWQYAVDTLAAFDGRTANFSAIDLRGRIDALILGNPTTLPDFLTSMRAAKPHWTIRTTDKLYLIEKGPYSRDLLIDATTGGADRGKISSNGDKPIVVARGDALEQPRQLYYQFIDSNRDYEPSTVSAAEDIDATPSFSTTNVSIPAVTTAIEALVDANFAFYWKETARQRSEYIGNESYFGIDAGDVHQINTDARTYFNSVSELVRNPDFTIDVKAEGFLTCGIAGAFYKSWVFDESCHQYTANAPSTDYTAGDTGDGENSDEAIAYKDGDFTTAVTIAVSNKWVKVSYDGGATGTWTVPGTDAGNFGGNTLSVSGNAAKILLCADSETIIDNDLGNEFHPEGARLQLSTDGAATWTPVGTNLGFRKWNTSCFATGAQVMYASANGCEISKSTDGGATWADLSGSPSDSTGTGGFQAGAQRIRCNGSGSHVIYNCGYTGKVYVSRDGGATWSNPLSLTSSATGAADCGVSDDGTVMIVTNYASNAIYISTDAGVSWSFIDPAPITPIAGKAPTTCNVSQDGMALIVGFSTAGDTVKAGVATSLDQGVTWTGAAVADFEWVASFIFDENF